MARRAHAADESWYNEPAQLRERAASYDASANEQHRRGRHEMAHAWRDKASVLRVRASSIETARSKG